MSQVNGNSQQLHVTMFQLFETDRFAEMVGRPLTSHVTGQVLNAFQEATQHGQFLDHTTLSGVAGQFIMPSAETFRTPGIINGWSEARFRFIMELQENAMGVGLRTILTGYTDHYGYAPGSTALDPKMALYFTNVIRVRDQIVNGPNGPQTITTLLDADMILKGLAASGYQSGLRNEQALRPVDVFSSLAIPSQYNQPGIQLFDGRTSFQAGAQLSRTDNAIPSRWAEKVFQGFTAASTSVDVMDAEQRDLHRHARGIVAENQVSNIGVLDTMSYAYDWRSRGYIQLCELEGLCAHLSHVTEVFPFSQAERMAAYTPGHSCNWEGNSNEQVAASMVLSVMASMMWKFMLGYCNFTLTNATHDGSYRFNVISNDPSGSDAPRSYVRNLDISQYVAHFGQCITRELMPGLTRQGALVVTLNVFSDLMGTTTIDVSINGQPFVRFIAPTFANSLYTPLIGTDRQSLVSLSADVDNLLSHVGMDNMPMQNYTPHTEAGRTRWG
jgi:hypothetical protein